MLTDSRFKTNVKEMTTNRINGFAFQVFKNGELIGGSDLKPAAIKLARQMNGVVIERKNLITGRK